MSSPEQWRELLAAYTAEVARVAQAGDLFDATTPNAGATEEQIREAETRLGYRLPDDHRTMLSVANGWDDYDIGESILGTDELGQGPRWEAMCETLAIFFGEGDWLAEKLGVEKNWPHLLPVIAYDNGWTGECFLYTADGGEHRAGAAFELGDFDVIGGGIHSDFYDLMSAKLTKFREFVDWEVKGDHARTWGRDIRVNPPTVTQILDKVDELSAEAGSDARIGRRPGVTDAELAELEKVLGTELHVAHRAVLQTSNGLDHVNIHILSADEIADVDSWEQLRHSAADSEIDSQLWIKSSVAASTGESVDEDAIRDEITGRLAKIPAIPFAHRQIVAQRAGDITGPSVPRYWVYGVDRRDGAVRSLLDDPLVTPLSGAYEPSRGDAREYLLAFADDAYWRAEAMKNIPRAQ
ncbi:SMI1/KNR4 family protein [Gordonia sp. CPCC 205333]|uniref:SMI1/KNR4 family protein n=1 Tax=Gordonia sp. CPCC 205333 TaxID=3140790 RepID=UPI003AF3A46F